MACCMCMDWNASRLSPRAGGIVVSSPERAILELRDEPTDNALVHEVDAVLQGLAALWPQLVTTLLQYCRSIKAKRLLLALTERHHHSWLPHVKLQNVDLGRGKRVLVRGGKLNTEYDLPRLSVDIDLTWLPVGEFASDAREISAALEQLGETLRSGPLRLQVQTSGTEATGRFPLRSSHDPRILLVGYRSGGSQPLLYRYRAAALRRRTILLR